MGSTFGNETPRQRRTLWGTLSFLLIAVFVSMLGGCGQSEPSTITLRIGTTDDKGSGWEAFLNEAAQQGLDLQVVSSWNYIGPNDQLVNKTVDVNLAQHLRSLATYNLNHQTHLVPIASTYIVPLGLYSHRHVTLEDIPQGGKIAIPDYPPDTARALFVLRDAGLITLQGSPWSPTVNDVDPSSTVTLEPTPSTFLAHAYREYDGAVINNTWLPATGASVDSALAHDDPQSVNSPDAQHREPLEQYINVLVVRPEDKDNPVYRKLADVYHSEPVQKAFSLQSSGSQISVTKTSDELQRLLSEIEKKIQSETH